MIDTLFFMFYVSFVKKTNQQRQNIAAYFIFRFFSFIVFINYPKCRCKFSENSLIITIFAIYFK